MAIIKDLTFTDYRVLHLVNQSSLRRLLNGVADYWIYDERNPHKIAFADTEAMRFGRIAHSIISGEKSLDDLYPMKTIERDIRAAEWLEIAQGLGLALLNNKPTIDDLKVLIGDETLVSRKQFNVLKMAKNAIEGNIELQKHLDAADKELTLTFDLSGMECKARLDGLLEGHTIVEIKTYSRLWLRGDTDDERAAAFMSQVLLQNHYDFQAVWYKKAAEANGFKVDYLLFIFINSDTGAVDILPLDLNKTLGANFIKNGNDKIEQVLKVKAKLETEVKLFGEPQFSVKLLKENDLMGISNKLTNEDF
jgi:PDDEXK-like domain of unknown function (DUF3799)